MNNTKYTGKEIEWAINELKKKHPERANREQAKSLLNTLRGLPKIIVEKIEKDKQSLLLRSKKSAKKLK